MTSVLNVDSIAAKDGMSPVALTKQTAAKHFLSFDGNTENNIKLSFNTSSVADSGTGAYAVTVTNAMSSAFSTVLGTAYRAAHDVGTNHGQGMASTTSYSLDCRNSSAGLADIETGSAIHGDLA